MIPSLFQWWGELFPYTNFHDMNLDWVIRILKTISEKMPEEFSKLVDEINTKMQKATNEGQSGDLLTSNGDGTHTWKPFDTAVSDIVIDTVNRWLEDHPEATTTVQDGAISPAKLDTELYNLYKEQGKVQFFIPAMFNQNTNSSASGCTGLMVTPTKTILFDAGEEHHETEIINYYQELYNARVFTNLDCVIISHYHHDHIECLEAILEAFPHNNSIAYIPLSPSGYYAGAVETSLINNYDNVKRVCINAGMTVVEITTDQTITIDNLVSIDLFNSNPENYSYYSNNQFLYNDYSMVSLVKIGNTYAMFPGDLGMEGQKKVMEQRELPRLDFYLVHHHGVNNGEAGSDNNRDYTPYIWKINPLYSVIPADYPCAQTYYNYGIFQKLNTGFMGCTAYDYYSFVSDFSSCSITHGRSVINGGAYDSYITYIVDNSYTGDVHEGTLLKPFTTIDEAISFVKDCRSVIYNIKVKHTNTPYTPVHCRNIKTPIEISAYDSSLKPHVRGIRVTDCDYIQLSNIYLDSETGFPNYPINGLQSLIVLSNSTLIFNSCTIDGSIMPNNQYAISIRNSKLRFNGGTFTNFIDGIRPFGISMYSIVEASNTAFSNISGSLAYDYTIEMNFFDGCTFTNVNRIIFDNGRPYNYYIAPSLITAENNIAPKTSYTALSKIIHLSTEHPAVIITNYKIIDILTGQEVTL